MGTINEDLGRLRTGKATGVCADCGEEMPNGQLNYEATVHHGTRKVVCLERSRASRGGASGAERLENEAGAAALMGADGSAWWEQMGADGRRQREKRRC